jgi:hypothetical protein
LAAFLWRKVKSKFQLASLESLTNSKNLPKTIYKELMAAYRKLPIALKIVPKAAFDSENFSESRL